MSALRRHALPRFLRAFVSLVLVLGMLARPLAVFACDIEDARRAIVAGQGIATDSATQAGGDHCCANAACGECCAPVPLAVPAVARFTAHAPALPPVLPEPPDRLEAADYPVNSRPPIHV